MNDAKPQVAPQAFAALVRAVELDTVFLLETACSRVWAVPDHPPNEPAPDIESDVNVEATAELIDGEKRALVCRVTLRFEGTLSKQRVIGVSATYVASYSINGDFAPSSDVIEFFARNNAVFNVWAFFREHAASLTLKMGFPPFTLPLLHPA